MTALLKTSARTDCRYFIALVAPDFVHCAELCEPGERFGANVEKCARCDFYEPKDRKGEPE